MADVIILGGGVAGLTMAAALLPAKLRIAIVEARQPQPFDQTLPHQRVSAINIASQRIFTQLGIWQKLEHCSPFRHVHVWDDTQKGHLHFDSSDVSEPALGHIVPNSEIQFVLWQHLQQHQSQIEFYCPNTSVNFRRDDDGVQVELSNQQKINAKLIIGADGARSWLRDQLSISMQQKSYEHTAVVATIRSEKPHHQTARQRFMSRGPLALLPLLDAHTHSIVWSTTPEHAAQLVNDSDQMANEICYVLANELGEIKIIDSPQSFPLVMRHVDHYVLPRVALLGDAAHSLHPLAGQGMNLGIMDAACLASVINEAVERGCDIGSLTQLRRYERWRRGDNQMMITAMSALKHVFGWQVPMMQTARTTGLTVTNHWRWLKQHFIYHALGLRGELPPLAKVLTVV